MTNARHLSLTDRWYTPLDIIDKSKQVLGPIDLDPASDDFGNSRVGASTFFTKEQNGLVQEWGDSKPRTIFINPPSGKRGNKSLAILFWEKIN